MIAARSSTSPSCHRALSAGCSATVRVSAAITIGSGEVPSSPRRASSAVQSTVRNTVTCGMAACRSRLSAIARRVEPANVEPGIGEPAVAGALVPRPLGGCANVLGGDPTVRSGPGHRRQIDTQLLRQLPHRRGGLDAFAGRSLTAVERHQRLADRDGPARRPVQRGHHPRERRGDLDGRLRGLDLDEWLVQGDGVADLDEPGDDLALFETLAQVRHREHPTGHQYFTVSRIAAAMRGTLGR